jgi:hypothetical protein
LTAASHASTCALQPHRIAGTTPCCLSGSTRAPAGVRVVGPPVRHKAGWQAAQRRARPMRQQGRAAGVGARCSASTLSRLGLGAAPSFGRIVAALRRRRRRRRRLPGTSAEKDMADLQPTLFAGRPALYAALYAALRGACEVHACGLVR